MKIPVKYSLGGIERKVIKVDTLDHDDCYGFYDAVSKDILISEHADGKRIKKDEKELTYIHELVHAILDVMGEKKLYSNEKFVSNLSTFLYESFKTAQYK